MALKSFKPITPGLRSARARSAPFGLYHGPARALPAAVVSPARRPPRACPRAVSAVVAPPRPLAWLPLHPSWPSGRPRARCRGSPLDPPPRPPRDCCLLPAGAPASLLAPKPRLAAGAPGRRRARPPSRRAHAHAASGPSSPVGPDGPPTRPPLGRRAVPVARSGWSSPRPRLRRSVPSGPVSVRLRFPGPASGSWPLLCPSRCG